MNSGLTYSDYKQGFGYQHCHRWRPGKTGDLEAHLVGSLDECRRKLQAFHDVGVTHFIINPFCNPDEAIDQVDMCAREILGRSLNLGAGAQFRGSEISF